MNIITESKLRNLIKEALSEVLLEHDSYYTQYSDIENELSHYRKYFYNKVVMLCCDKPYISKFWDYFSNNMGKLNIPMVVSTFWSNNDEMPAKMTILTNNGIKDVRLKGNGDFLSDEVKQIMGYVDIVVTNPPFGNGMFSKFLQSLKQLNKKFIVIGPTKSGYDGKVFNMIKDGNVSIGYNSDMKFTDQRDGGKKKQVQSTWFTNMEKPNKGNFRQSGNTKNYQKYDNFNAINVDYVKDIPSDYDGMIGVPPSVITSIDLNLYRLIGSYRNLKINGKVVPKRIVIQRK
jgi:hypothetical protein